MSFVLHAFIAAPLILPRTASSDQPDRIEQLVTFFVPPDRPAGSAGSGGSIDWSGAMERSGAMEEPLDHAEPEETIPLGPPGDLLNPLPDDLPEGALTEETALTEIEVDSAVVRDPRSAAPIYPPLLLAQNLEGSTFVNYVVDSTGRVDSMTIRVIHSSHPDFTASVRTALTQMFFRPAIQASKPVRQWVQQNFAFRIVRPAPADSM